MMRPIVFNVPVPPAPTGLTATASGLGMTLNWTGGGNTRTYTIQRSSSSTFTPVDANWQNIGFPPGTSFSDPNGSTAMFYRVRAENGSGVSLWSNTAGGPIVPPPAPPSSVTATAVALKNAKTDTITVSWPALASNQTGFTVQYATNSSFTGATSSAPLAATATTLTISNALRGTRYYIRVQSFNASGTSAWVNANPYPLLTP
jgi:hypothetical protein